MDIRPSETPSYNAVKNAYSKQPRLITENLEQNFRAAIHAKSNLEAISKSLISSSGSVRKHSGMQRTASAFSIDRVFSAPHNPFRNRTAVETPSSLVENIQRFRYYFKYEPLVGTAIELHSEFPLSTFELKHDDPTLREEFNDISEDLNLFEHQLDMAMEYFLIGECFSFGIFDDEKNPSCWKAFTLLNPLFVNVEAVSLTDGRPNTSISLQIDETIKTVVANGPSHVKTGELYQRIPKDIIEACRGSGFIKLNPIQVSHFKRKGNYFKVRGESLLNRIIHLLNYRDKLRDAQYSIADRHVTPREVWKVGNDAIPATEEELQALADLVSNSYLDPSQAVIWHHALQVDVIGTADKVMPLRQELDGIEEEMLTGLMLNKGFLDSNYGAYANMSVALDVLISRYLTFRQRMERWQKESVWAPLCRIHNIYKPTQAELSHRIRIKNQDKKPWVPEISWSKSEMRDATARVNLLMTLREKLGGKSGKPGYPKDLIYQAVGDNPTVIERMLEKEAKKTVLDSKTNVDLGKGMGPAPGGMGGLPDLSIDSGALGGSPAGGGAGSPSGKLDVDPAKLPEYGGAPSGGDGSNRPPVSQQIQNDKSPTS